eukprot:2026644-Pyramimonas_sp.AAC.1
MASIVTSELMVARCSSFDLSQSLSSALAVRPERHNLWGTVGATLVFTPPTGIICACLILSRAASSPSR